MCTLYKPLHFPYLGMCSVLILANCFFQIIVGISDVMGIKGVNTEPAYGMNDCYHKKNNCSHLCFHKPHKGSICACPTRMELAHDRKTCKSKLSACLFGSLLFFFQFFHFFACWFRDCRQSVSNLAGLLVKDFIFKILIGSRRILFDFYKYQIVTF